MSEKVRQGSEDKMNKMDKQETSTEDIKRIVREGLMTMSDTVEREITGMSEKMAETVRRNVEVEVDEIKSMMERSKRKDELIMERMKKLEERLKESEDKETIASKGWRR